MQRENLGFICLRTEKAYVTLLTLLRMAVMVFVIVHISNSIVQSFSNHHSMTSHISVSCSLTAPPKKVMITAESLLFSLTAVLTHCHFPKLCCAFNLLFPEGQPDIAQEPSEQ
jgi:hypothetical protein